jgi:DNA-binding PadR family transcriptional regulator
MSKGDPLPLLSTKETLILELLTAARESYGLQLVEASGGRLKRGTVYVTLGRMEERGYVSSRAEEPRPGAIGLPRRLYRPTALGRRVLEARHAVERVLAWEGGR